MKITFNPSFSSRKPNIRKADDIQRKIKKTFPGFSPSYMRNFYILNGINTNSEREKRANELSRKYLYLLLTNREKQSISTASCSPEVNENLFFIKKVVNAVKKKKIANCHELSLVTLAALAANGYTDVKRVFLKLNAVCVNKKTKKIEFSQVYDLDHVVTLTALNKKNPKDSDLIVVDPWMGFADSISGAQERYTSLIDFDESKADFAQFYSPKGVTDINEQQKYLDELGFDVQYNIMFVEENSFPDNPKFSKKELKTLASYMQKKYPDLCL